MKKKGKIKKIIRVGIISILIILFIVMFSLYLANENFRNFFDMQILRKEVLENNLVSIELNADSEQYIYAYDKYITILEKNSLKNYVSSGEKVSELEINISKPIYDSNNRFLIVGEEKGQKLYLISGENIIWQNTIEGEIKKVNVNKNGYVSVIVTGTTYQTIIITYNTDGKELFKTYLSTTSAVATDISNDNKYLAVAEVDMSGTLINSNVKVISIEKAQTEPSNSVVEKYDGNINSVIIDVNYQNKNNLYCMYDDRILLISQGESKNVYELKNKESLFADINLVDGIIIVKEKSDLFNKENSILLKEADVEKEYVVQNSVKAIRANDKIIAINLVSEAHFINNKGWLLKKYKSSQEIKDIILGDSIAGIVYREKIEIVGL